MFNSNVKKNSKRTPVVFYIGLAILCMVIFSSHFTSGLYARYTSSAQGSDSARVAKFSVSAVMNSESAQDFALDAFDSTKLSCEYKFDVSTNSEVAVKYSVVITFPEDTPIPTWLSVNLTNESGDYLATSNHDNKTFTFQNIGSFTTGENSRTHTLKFFINDAGLKDDDYSFNGIKITVKAEQID